MPARAELGLASPVVAALRAVVLTVGCALLLAPMARAAPGDLDPNYGENGVARPAETDSSTVSAAIRIRPNGGVFFYRFDPAGEYDYTAHVVALTTRGKPDASFASNGAYLVPPGVAPFGAVVGADGSLTITGYNHPYQEGASEVRALRVTSAGNPDHAFGTSGLAVIDLPDSDAAAFDAVGTMDGKVVIEVTADGGARAQLIKLDDSGQLDPSFGTGGVSEDVYGGPQILTEDRDGNLLLDGSNFTKSIVSRFDATGALDTTFGQGGSVGYNPRGANPYDTSFVAEPSGGVIVATDVSTFNDEYKSSSRLVRLDSEGNLDPGFDAKTALGRDPSSNRRFIISDIEEDARGRIVAAGAMERPGYPEEDFSIPALERLHHDGSLDTSFGEGGISIFRPEVLGTPIIRSIAIQRDGKVVANGGGVTTRFLAGPGPANADADPFVGKRDECPRLPVFGPKSRGCPRIATRVSLRYKRLHGFAGRLYAPLRCRIIDPGKRSIGVGVRVMRVARGPDIAIGRAVTQRITGNWHLAGSKEPGHGHYYAEFAGRINHMFGACAKSRSPRLFIGGGVR